MQATVLFNRSVKYDGETKIFATLVKCNLPVLIMQLISSKLTRQSLKPNDLTMQADPHQLNWLVLWKSLTDVTTRNSTRQAFNGEGADND